MGSLLSRGKDTQSRRKGDKIGIELRSFCMMYVIHELLGARKVRTNFQGWLADRTLAPMSRSAYPVVY